MIEARSVELDLGRLAQRIVDADLLDEATIARAAAVGSHDTVEGSFLAASASETKGYGHTGNPGNKSRRSLQMFQARVKRGSREDAV